MNRPCHIPTARTALVGSLLVIAILSARPAQAQTLITTYTFAGSPDGAVPIGDLTRDTAGNLYGTTAYGGNTGCELMYGCGTVFKVDATGEETVLYTFAGGRDGSEPNGGLVLDAQGNLYGTTAYGGAPGSGPRNFGYGTLFKLDAAGHKTVLHNFAAGLDGAIPFAGLIRDSEGNLYGTTFQGGGGAECSQGLAGCGTIFKVDATGKETVLYRFSGGADGALPHARLINDSQGNFYGTAENGGLANCDPYGQGCGVVFKLSALGQETVLHTFTGSSGADGADPVAGLIRDAAGSLYGTTIWGGGSKACYVEGGCGTVFRVDVTGQETVLYSFTGGTDGGNPSAGLIRDVAGNIYGVTYYGGDSACNYGSGCGVVFQLDANDNETVLHSFAGKPDGAYPATSLIGDGSGNAFGASSNGGESGCTLVNGCGILFKLIP